MNDTYTPESLLEAFFEGVAYDLPIESYELTDDFNIRITLKGGQWDGLIDYKVANFVIKLQRDVLRVYNSIANESISLRLPHDFVDKFVIKVEIKNNCTDLLVQFKDVVKTMVSKCVDKVDGKQISFALIVAMLCATGLVANSQIQERIGKLSSKVEDEETKRRILKTADKALEAGVKNQEAIVYLVSSLSSGDTVRLPGQNVDFNKEDALKRFEKKKDSSIERTYYVDGQYRVARLDLEAGTLMLKQGKSKPIEASTKTLSEQYKVILHEKVAKADLDKTVPVVDLQISVVVSGCSVEEAYVTGIGQKRKGSVPLSKVTSFHSGRNKSERMSLLDIDLKK